MKLYSMTGNNIEKMIHFITIEHSHMCVARGTPYWVINIFSTTEIRFIWLSFFGTVFLGLKRNFHQLTHVHITMKSKHGPVLCFDGFMSIRL